jgi:hypothetical protein
MHLTLAKKKQQQKQHSIIISWFLAMCDNKYYQRNYSLNTCSRHSITNQITLNYIYSMCFMLFAGQEYDSQRDGRMKRRMDGRKDRLTRRRLYILPSVKINRKDWNSPRNQNWSTMAPSKHILQTLPRYGLTL